MQMNALVLNGAFDFSYERRAMPVRKPGEVLVKVRAVGICGSDVAAVRGGQPLFRFPRVIGHEVCAEVLEADAGSGFVSGDLACLMPCIPCRTCIACRKGKPNCCASLRLYGVQEDGGLQEYLSLPAGYFLNISIDADPKSAAVIEPLTIGAHAVAKLPLQKGDRVLVLGAGPIGVTCALAAASRGACVLLAELLPERRSFVQNTFGYKTVDPLSPSYRDDLSAFTQGEGFHGVVDTTANKGSMENAFRFLGHGGHVVFVGMVKGTLEIDEAAFHMYEPTLSVTRNSTRADYERVLSLWRGGQLDPGALVTHITPFHRAGLDIIDWVEAGGAVFKGVVVF